MCKTIPEVIHNRVVGGRLNRRPQIAFADFLLQQLQGSHTDACCPIAREFPECFSTCNQHKSTGPKLDKC